MHYTFWNTTWPLLLSAFLAFLPWLVLNRILPVKKKKRCQVLLFFLCTVLMAIPCFIGDLHNLPFSFLAFFLSVWISCQAPLEQKLAAALLVSGSAFSVNALADNFLKSFAGWTVVYSPWYWVVKTGYWLVLFGITRKLFPKKGYFLPVNFWRLLLLLFLPPFGILSGPIILADSGFDSLIENNGFFFAWLFVLCMLYWVILLLAVPVLARQQDLEKKAHFSQMRWQYYQMVEHQQKEVRKLKHDMRNHLTALSGLTGKERDQYLQDLLDAPALNTKVTFCENQTANILLASKMEQAQELQACLDIEADIPDLPGIDPMDLCSLLGNALDNALEAVAKLPTKQRRISFHARAQKGLFVTEVRNSCAFSPSRDNTEGLPKTWKKDSKNHGLGLSNMQEIVERYGGRMNYQESPSEFVLFFYLSV